MTVSSHGVDNHAAACDALERSTPLLVQAVRRAPADARPARMRWTNAEIAAHLFASATEAEKAARGAASVYDAGPSAALDEQMVASVDARDPGVLADMIDEATTALLTTVRGRPGNEPIAVPRATVGTFVGLIALDHHLHGGQFAATSATAWEGRVADMYAPLRAVLPYAFDPAAAEGFRGSYTLRLRGVDPIGYAVEDARLLMDPAGRTDCTVTADPQTFLRVGIGVVSQLRATLTGRMRAGGRKPWLALATTRLFPPIPHGGVQR